MNLRAQWIMWCLLLCTILAQAALPLHEPTGLKQAAFEPPTLTSIYLQSYQKKIELPLALRTEQGEEWLDMGQCLQALGVTIKWHPLLRQVDLHFESKVAYLTLGFPVIATTDSTLITKRAPTLRKGSLWMNLSDASHVMGILQGVQLQYDSRIRTLSVSPLKDILAVKLESKKNGDLLEIKLSRKIRYETFFHPPHFILRLENATLDSSLFQSLTGNLVKKIVPVQEKQTAQITIQVHNGSEGGEVIEKDSGSTLQILFRKPQANDTTVLPTPTSNSKKVRTIIIDPGHGGKDPGALGLKSQEKDIVLAVGLKLKDKLQKAGFKAFMTRDNDTFVELQDRPAMASKREGDLFISLHCNAVDGNTDRKNKVDGFKVYILREAESEEDKAIERRENKAALLSSKKAKSEISPVEWILLENQLNLYTKESELFTAGLVESMTQTKVNKQGSGAGQAGFMVLVGAYMPAVLVELGFITNPKDEEYLISKSGQEALAERILKAVIGYRDAMERNRIN